MKKTKICNYVSAALMGLLAILHFMPFWHYDGISTSIGSYIGYPTNDDQLHAYIAAQTNPDYRINEIITMPLLVWLLVLVGVVVCTWKAEHFLSALVPLACGLIGIWGYFSHPAFQLGSNWGVHAAVCLLMVLTAVLFYVFWYQENGKI